MSSNISLNDTSFYISLNSLGFYLSPECSLNFFKLFVPLSAVKIFSFMLLTFLEDALNQSIFTYASVPQLKIRVEFFENLFPPRQKGWRKLWFAFIKIQSENIKMTWKINLFKLFYFFCMICSFFKCDGFTVLWTIFIKECGITFITSHLQPW